jgi:hypothetical protein
MQATTFNVSDKLTFAHTDTDTDSISTTYDCNVEVQLAGDSAWDCEIEAVTVTSIHIHENFDEDGDSSIHITVCYNVDGDAEYEGSWRLYTDSGFEEAISELLGTRVFFTEQGMQDDGFASME